MYFLANTPTTSFPLFQTSFGNALRGGLCILESSKLEEIRILKRGIPKIYEVNFTKTKGILFHKKLMKFVDDLFRSNNVHSLSVYQSRILSETHIQIAYDVAHCSWLISTHKHYAVVFKDHADVNQLLAAHKISDTLYDVCVLWLNILSKMAYANAEMYKEFLSKCAIKTLIGYFIAVERKRLVFTCFVYNMEQLSQFTAAFGEMDFFFQKYNLPYEKITLLPRYKVYTVDELNKTVQELYKATSCDVDGMNGDKGSVFFLSSEMKHVVTGFKVKRRELCVSSQLTRNIVGKKPYISEKCVNSQIKNSAESFKKLLGSCVLHNSKCKCSCRQKTIIETNLFLIKESCSNISDKHNNDSNNLVLLPNSLHNIQTKQSNGTSMMGEFAAKLRSPKRSQGQSNSQIMKTLSKFTKGSYSRKEVSPLRKMSTFETVGGCEFVDEKGKGSELRKARSVNNACYNRKKMNGFIGGVCNGSGGGGRCKGERKVAFVDEKYYIPLVEVVEVQSYKKYNLNESEGEKSGGSGSGRMDNRKNVCCVIG